MNKDLAYVKLMLEDISTIADKVTSGNVSHNIAAIKCDARKALECIDSLQEEPVSEGNTLRKASEEYLKVLSETPYNNTPITNAQTIVRELITFLDSPSKYSPNHIEEPVSEELDEAALMHFKDVMEYEIKTGHKMANMTSFKFGANWKEQQMMAKAVKGYVIEDIEEGNGDFLLSADYLPKSMDLKDQQKVKVIVIKED